MDILDAVSELEITLKKEAAILESFMNEYVIKPQADVALAIDTRFEQFQYTAHVVADLMSKAKEQIATLDALAGEEWKASPHKCG